MEITTTLPVKGANIFCADKKELLFRICVAAKKNFIYLNMQKTNLNNIKN